MLGLGLGLASLLLAMSFVVGSEAAAAPKDRGNHCVSPAGEDLNEVFGTRDAFIAPFCNEAHVGDRWRAVLRVQAAGDDPVFPPGYVPSTPLLDEDFLAKFVAGRYVVDAGTKRERSYTFSRDELIVENGALPDDTRFVRWTTPSLHPLPPGQHTVDEYIVQSADFWDGLGLDPAVNFGPAGESLVGSVEFSVVKRK